MVIRSSPTGGNFLLLLKLLMPILTTLAICINCENLNWEINAFVNVSKLEGHHLPQFWNNRQLSYTTLQSTKWLFNKNTLWAQLSSWTVVVRPRFLTIPNSKHSSFSPFVTFEWLQKSMFILFSWKFGRESALLWSFNLQPSNFEHWHRELSPLRIPFKKFRE